MLLLWCCLYSYLLVPILQSLTRDTEVCTVGLCCFPSVTCLLLPGLPLLCLGALSIYLLSMWQYGHQVCRQLLGINDVVGEQEWAALCVVFVTPFLHQHLYCLLLPIPSSTGACQGSSPSLCHPTFLLLFQWKVVVQKHLQDQQSI